MQPNIACRLDALQAQCELWSGPIAAVAYIPLFNGKVVSMDEASLNGTTVAQQHQKLALFHDRVTKAGEALHLYAAVGRRQQTCSSLKKVK